MYMTHCNFKKEFFFQNKNYGQITSSCNWYNIVVSRSIFFCILLYHIIYYRLFFLKFAHKNKNNFVFAETFKYEVTVRLLQDYISGMKHNTQFQKTFTIQVKYPIKALLNVHELLTGLNSNHFQNWYYTVQRSMHGIMSV